DFNSYGSRRGNHEVMVRGTFANVRLRNKLVATEGGFTRHLPTNTEMSIFDASEKYREAGTPLIILAGKEYGSGSSRDWAAKGPPDIEFNAVVRIDTPQEALYYANGGILQYVLRQLLATKKEPVGV